MVIFMTAPNAEIAQQIAESLVTSRLAACVNTITSIRSVYIWEGKVNHDEEVLMIAKTRKDLFGEEFIQAVKRIHPYQVPEIIALPIRAGSDDYIGWIMDVTKK